MRDTYLSPSTDINYTGWVARVLNERMKIVRLADYNVSRQQLINVEFGSTRNGAETANEMPDLWTTVWVIITVFRKCCPD